MRYLFLSIFLTFCFSCTNPIDEKRLIDMNQFEELVSQKDKTLVYIWTTWCSGCRKSLEYSLPKLMKDLNQDEYQLILIAASKNKEEVDSLVTASGLENASYFLDFLGPDKGKFQAVGIRQFMSANFKGEEIYTGGIPVFFLVNREMKVLHKKLPHTYDEAIELLQ
ncbi:TlpA family protein disulfide reductase [Marinifilum caeruleilacunae]|uniref:Redoxin domain-containing protein n=1 Tax=Marinifilum caeruleilacunae TaxID=2499076 RepID=A0ABX1WVB5_9BACT|nr:redoxin family protein [Marinifilum caeruleilacunae]NOU59896.1 hypothetical protein [Marinifilum caeruleilacunae]